MSERSRLAWRCRRGPRELELLLEGFLAQHYERLSAPERRSFAALLELQDPELLELLMGRAVSQDPQLAQLLERIRAWLPGAVSEDCDVIN
jgi:antitoxin CptB